MARSSTTFGSKYRKRISPAELVTRAARELERHALRECFVAHDLSSRPTAGQEEVMRGIQQFLIRYMVSGNQGGKTSTPVREITWLVQDEHPFFVRPTEWGAPGSPLLILACGQDRAQLDNIWQSRIKPFLNPDEWREHRVSSTLQSVSHKTRGHQIIFLSHNNSSEHDIKHLQSYTAHYVWVDEMPASIRVLEELQRRVDAKRGRFICTFTMKVRRDEIRKLVDASDGVVSRKYQLNQLDNPIYKGREQEQLDKIAALPPELQAAILTGAWLISSTQVYSLIRSKHVGRPLGYNPSWRHVAISDPATESKLGLEVWAERPLTDAKEPGEGVWWCVFADYVEGIFVPSLIVARVEELIRSFNIVDRIYDTAAPWFAHQARQAGYKWRPVPNKSGRKARFISDFQEALGTTCMIAEWCPKFITELETCERSESNDKVANSSKYHLIDCGHYFVQMRPPPDRVASFTSHADFLIQRDNAIRTAEAREKKKRLLKYVTTRRTGHFKPNRLWTK